MSSGPALAATTALALLAFAANSLLCRYALADGSTNAATFTAIRLGAGALVLQDIPDGSVLAPGGTEISKVPSHRLKRI